MKFLERPVNWLLAISLAALVVLSNWAVFQRYVLSQPLHFAEEMSVFLFIWIVMLGAIAAEKDDRHLTISVLTDAFPAKLGKVLDLILSLLSIVVLLYAAKIGLDLALASQTRVTQILRIPYFWIYIAFPIGCAGICIFMAHRLIGVLRSLTGDKANG
jgi:TRAP-type C4-dicarboxylate transport system, small permease component